MCCIQHAIFSIANGYQIREHYMLWRFSCTWGPPFKGQGFHLFEGSPWPHWPLRSKQLGVVRFIDFCKRSQLFTADEASQVWKLLGASCECLFDRGIRMHEIYEPNNIDLCNNASIAFMHIHAQFGMNLGSTWDQSKDNWDTLGSVQDVFLGMKRRTCLNRS